MTHMGQQSHPGERPVRILHVLGGMNRGGAETWLMHVLRHIDRERFRMDFLVHTTVSCAYDDEVRALGSRIIPCLRPSRPWQYARSFRRIMRECGPYDVVHSHVHQYSGFVLRLARHAGVPMRIAHSHADIPRAQTPALRRLYLSLMEHWVRTHASLGLACSAPAAADLFGPTWQNDGRWRVLRCGIDLTPFREGADRDAVRSELGIPPDAFVIGHVGRFHEQKNHPYIPEVAALVMRRAPNTRLLLIGDGPLRPAIERQAADMGLADRLLFAGVRSDVPSLMTGVMDVFVFPSLWEGLPVTLLEAQAAGLACLISDVITEEADVVPGLVCRMSLAQPPSAWAQAATDMLAVGPAVTPADALVQMQRSPFHISSNVEALQSIYARAQGQSTHEA